MSATSTAIRPDHKAIRAYFDRRAEYAGKGVTHESGLRPAFFELLEETASPHRWTVVAEQSMKAGPRTIRPDATLRDAWNLRCGFWEAKDSDDDLEAEIRRKIDAGYPLSNTIFEDSRRAVLFQHGQEAMRVDLDDPVKLAHLLNAFYEFDERERDEFQRAVEDFHHQIPDLAEALQARIDDAHGHNPTFRTAFDDFLELCRRSIDPDLKRATVDEMLVQHLLTERLFRAVFADDDFTRRNAIAAEIEKVIDALAGRSFNRAEFFRRLDPFFKAIERKAHRINDWSDKQAFLNTVYERFFQGYSTKTADTHGIVYTPQEIVDFMCASVAEALTREFDLNLGDDGVCILDPCTGTGNFVVNLIGRMPFEQLEAAYRDRLFANEIQLLPYYIASLNIERAYYERTGHYEAFPGLCFADTLDLVEHRQPVFAFANPENTERVEREMAAPITVIVGNPPYNVGQISENDNNKNRTYKRRSKTDPEGVDDRIKATFGEDSNATNKNALGDVYVKFFRWAVDRLGRRDGLICFVSNNSFVDSISFDGMRKHLAEGFDRIYIFDTRGNKRLIGMRQTLDGRNVFGDMVRVGVCISVLIRKREGDGPKAPCQIAYHAVGDRMKAREKLAYLATYKTIYDVPWTSLTPDAKGNWLVPDGTREFDRYISMSDRAGSADEGERQTLFRACLPAGQTNRDSVVFNFSRDGLAKSTNLFARRYNAEVHRIKEEFTGKLTELDEFLDYSEIKWSSSLKTHALAGRRVVYSEQKIRYASYRAFTTKYLFLDHVAIHRPATWYLTFPTDEAESENRTIVLSDIGFRAATFSALATNLIADTHLLASSDAHQCFPFYTYDEDGTNRRENITDWALGHFRSHYGPLRMFHPAGPMTAEEVAGGIEVKAAEEVREVAKWDIFHYVYAVLHHPAYRERFGEVLRKELPRLPLLPEFAQLAATGRALAGLHVHYEHMPPHPGVSLVETARPVSWRVERMKLSKDETELTVNDTLKLVGIPPEASRYRLGNRSALGWVVDQHRINPKTGEDPNRPDAPRHLVDLARRVIAVATRTVELIETLPPWPETSGGEARPRSRSKKKSAGS